MQFFCGIYQFICRVRSYVILPSVGGPHSYRLYEEGRFNRPVALRCHPSPDPFIKAGPRFYYITKHAAGQSLSGKNSPVRSHEAAFHSSCLILLERPDFPDHFLFKTKYRKGMTSAGFSRVLPGCLQQETGCDIILSGPASP